MQNTNVLENMTETYNEMTKSAKKVADYIFANIKEAQYMSITSLSEECGVADATVSRFCKNLGYDGYNEFKLALAKASGAKVSEPGTEFFDKIDTEDSIAVMAKKLYASNVAAMKQTLQLLDETAVERAVRYIYAAQRVLCFGQGGSGVMAKEAWARFITAASQFQCIEDSHMQTMAAALCTMNDVIWFFSYSGATKESLDILRTARERGAKVILVTHFPKSPASQYADVILQCGSKEGPLQGGSIPAKVSQMLIIDILFNEYCRTNSIFSDSNREIVAKAIAAKLL